MGREAKILLAFLGLLAGVFCGVLSMKLLVPRPPPGAGPDIHAADTFLGSTEIVDPPLLALRAADFAAAPPLIAEGRSNPPVIDPLVEEVAPTVAATRFPVAVPAAREAESLVDPATDPAIDPATDDLLPPPAEFVLAPPARPIDEPPAPPAEPREKDRSANGTSASVGRAARTMRSNSRDWPGLMRPDRGGAELLPVHAQGRICLVGADRP